ncbi:MAG TPA: hypothetical protein VFZ24_18725 [Longimicrobiales bacterium]
MRRLIPAVDLDAGSLWMCSCDIYVDAFREIARKRAATPQDAA